MGQRINAVHWYIAFVPGDIQEVRTSSSDTDCIWAILANLPNAPIMNPPEGGMPGGLLYYINFGVKKIFPPLIFLGVGAMTDFGPLLILRLFCLEQPLRLAYFWQCS